MQENEVLEEISFKDLIFKIKEWFHYLLFKWKPILLIGVIGGILGFTYAYLQKPIYTAETVFVLEESESGGSGLGALGGIASDIGLDLGGKGGGIFQGDNILHLYKSRRMIQGALLRKDTFNNKTQSLIERYIDFNNLKEKWAKNPELTNLIFQENPLKFNRMQDSLVTIIVTDINKNFLEVAKPDKKLPIISVKVKSEDEAFAKAFTNQIVKTVNEFYVRTKTKKSAENLAILQFQADSIKNALNLGISGVAYASDANPNTNPAFQTLRVPSQRKQIDVQANSIAYQEILKNLELAKISFRNDKPLIQVIDEPIFPLKKAELSKIITTILTFSLFSIFGMVFLVLKKIFND